MSSLTVIEFRRVEDAVTWERSLARRLTEQDTVVLDAAMLLWDSPRTAPQARHLTNLALHASAASTLWSLILGLTVNLRLLGEDAPLSVLEPVGVPADLLTDLRDSLLPGTAAIFLLTEEPLDPSVTEALTVVVHQTTLSARQDAKRQQVFCP